MRHRRTRPTSDTPPRGRPPRFRRRLPVLPALHKKLRPAGPAVAIPAVAATRPGSAAGVVAHVLRDGELILLVIRPSVWFMALQSWRWLAAGAAVVTVATAFGSHGRAVAEAGVAVAAARLMYAAVQWMGRVYVLTDQRLLTVTGVTRVDVADTPLRKVARTRLLRAPLETALGIGSVEIVPADPDQPFHLWQQVARPVQVHETIVAAINRVTR